MKRERLKQNLTALRKEIDKTDKTIALNLKKRFRLVEEIAKYKHARGIEIEDKERDEEVVKNYESALSIWNLPLYTFTKNLIALMLEYSKKIQEDVIKNEQRKKES